MTEPLYSDVPTAQQAVGVKATQSTHSAHGASSASQQRIDQWLRLHFEQAASADFSLVKESAESAARNGFKNCANLRYVEFLEAFRDAPHLTAHYTEHYPDCCFLGWKALRVLLRSLELWFELPEHYAGAIPPSLMPWIDLFELRKEDSFTVEEIQELLGCQDYATNPESLGVLFHLDMVARCTTYGGRKEMQLMDRSAVATDRLRAQPRLSLSDYARQEETLMRHIERATDSLFVVAPPEAFTTFHKGKDFISRFRSLADAPGEVPTIPPNDPLVVRLCKGGCLVVTAWGDEAAFINEAVRHMKHAT
jgi:hypothetical protein